MSIYVYTLSCLKISTNEKASSLVLFDWCKAVEVLLVLRFWLGDFFWFEGIKTYSYLENAVVS